MSNLFSCRYAKKIPFPHWRSLGLCACMEWALAFRFQIKLLYLQYFQHITKNYVAFYAILQSTNFEEFLAMVIWDCRKQEAFLGFCKLYIQITVFHKNTYFLFMVEPLMSKVIFHTTVSQGYWQNCDFNAKTTRKDAVELPLLVLDASVVLLGLLPCLFGCSTVLSQWTTDLWGNPHMKCNLLYCMFIQ